MASNNLEMEFGNELSEIKFIRRVLLELGIPDETNSEIDRAITLAKVDEFQERMESEASACGPMYDPDMLKNK